MLPICSSRGDQARVAHYTISKRRLADASECRPAGMALGIVATIYDNGQPIGSSESEECQIRFALVQAWAVLSKAAPKGSRGNGIARREERLVCRESDMIRY